MRVFLKKKLSTQASFGILLEGDVRRAFTGACGRSVVFRGDDDGGGQKSLKLLPSLQSSVHIGTTVGSGGKGAAAISPRQEAQLLVLHLKYMHVIVGGI